MSNELERRRKAAEGSKTTRPALDKMVGQGFGPVAGMAKENSDLHYMLCRDIANVAPVALQSTMVLMDRLDPDGPGSAGKAELLDRIVWSVLTAADPTSAGRVACLRDAFLGASTDDEKALVVRFCTMFTLTIVGLLAAVPAFRIGGKDPDDIGRLRMLARNAMFSNLSPETMKAAMRDIASLGDLENGQYPHFMAAAEEVLEEFRRSCARHDTKTKGSEANA